MIQLSNAQKIHWVLRVSIAMCFIGHGAFGIITKEIWCNYFAVFGIGKTMAYHLMPVLGTVDILLGLIFLVIPCRGIAAWLVIWGIVTAMCRPLSGEPFAEFIERAANFGVPFCFLLIAQKRKFNLSWFFAPVTPELTINNNKREGLQLILRLIVFLLFAGHGWLNLIPKLSLIGQYQSLGFQSPAHEAFFAGILELTAAVMILIRHQKPAIIFLICWKMGTELLYPHFGIFEWIERGCSYGSLIVLRLNMQLLPQINKRYTELYAGYSK